ncbi:MAG: polysaccharide biosynthesis C-terminal domain-containing protein [Bacteroidales bacterium]|nr:polysaccharide biosynthesis C-terminal domain-containing protein [Bacteroidales bacterium]
MFNKILNTFGTRIAAAILNFLIAVVISQTLGDVGKGVQSLMLTTITFILIFAEIVCGESVVFLASRHSFSKIAIPSFLWALLISVLMGAGLLLFPQELGSDIVVHVAILSFLASASAINFRFLVGKEEIKKANYNTLLQPVLIILTVLVYYVALKKEDIYGYIIALYLAYGCTFLLGVWMLRDEYRQLRLFQLREYREVLADLFKYGFLNQTGHFVQFFNLRLSYYLLYAYMDEGRVGVYSNAVSLAEAIWIVSNSIALVQYARIANANDRAYSQKLTLELGKICLLVSACAVVVLALLPAAVYQFVFGPEFGEMAGVIRILAPGVLLYCIFLILGHYYSGIGRYQMNTFAALCGLVATCVLGFTLIPRFDIRGAALTASVAYAVNALFLFVFFLREARFKCRDFLLTRQELRQYVEECKQYLTKTETHE